jgi:hypothetical protein
MRHKIIATLAALLFLIHLLSCNKEDDIILDKNGVAVKLPHIWNTPITDNQTKRSEVVIGTPIIFDADEILVGANKNLNRAILSLNSNDGKVNWQWNDLLSLLNNSNYKDPITLRKETYHQIDNKLFFNYSTSVKLSVI